MAQAYDQHLNMILGDVEETITSVEVDDETYEEIIKVCLLSISQQLHDLIAYVRVLQSTQHAAFAADCSTGTPATGTGHQCSNVWMMH